MKMTEKESIQINMQSMETGRWSDCDRIREIVYREENAIYKLEDIDDVRSHTLKFIESGKEIGVQVCAVSAIANQASPADRPLTVANRTFSSISPQSADCWMVRI